MPEFMADLLSGVLVTHFLTATELSFTRATRRRRLPCSLRRGRRRSLAGLARSSFRCTWLRRFRVAAGAALARLFRHPTIVRTRRVDPVRKTR